jgi:(2Fe-2S) ferredoxin
MSSPKTVLVCQNRTCRKQGSSKVLAAFQAHSVPGVAVVGCSCLGQCGNGPMVQICPDEIWYSNVHPDEVPAVVERHLLGNQPVRGMLYRKFHQLP